MVLLSFSVFLTDQIDMYALKSDRQVLIGIVSPKHSSSTFHSRANKDKAEKTVRNLVIIFTGKYKI